MRWCLVTGKGGTGKTTTAAAVAYRLAASGLRTLVISTDPAHSLGDALDVDLGSGALQESVDGPTTAGASPRGRICAVSENLDALEIDTTEAVEEFRRTISTQNVVDLGKLGLTDAQDLLDTVPPGADEFVALARVLDLTEQYDRVVMDTAPTGHTLRLLSFPDFLDSFLGKLLRLRQRLSGWITAAASTLSGKDWDSAARRVERFQQRMQRLSETLRDRAQTQFVIVTTPTDMAVAESVRLIAELTRKRHLAVAAVVVNMVLSPSTRAAYMVSLRQSQAQSLRWLHSALGERRHRQVMQVPVFDMDVSTPYGVQAFGAVIAPLVESSDPPLRKVVLTAAKGGCGKTTTAAAIAMQLARAGRRCIVVSTDPAHSLGDIFGVAPAPSSGSPYLRDITAVGDNLSVYEIDAEGALDEFRQVVDSLRSAKVLGMDLDIGDFSNVFDSLPPGIDELVALARVIGLLQGQYDHVVIDTAPTGHTLRLLSFPDFLDNLLGKLLRLKAKLDGVTHFFTKFRGDAPAAATDAGGTGGEPAAGTPAQRLERFRTQLVQLRDTLHDPEQCEVVLVTRPTHLNVAETLRLADALERQHIASHRLVINQVVPSTDADWGAFAARTAQVQQQRTEQLQEKLQQLAADGAKDGETTPLPLLRVPYFDREVRAHQGSGRGGLEVFGQYLFPESEN